MNIGVDIVYIKRFSNLLEKKHLFNKMFSSNEIEYIKSRDYNTNTIAGIFAAKEALLKSLKLGMDSYPFNEIEILHYGTGIPFIKLNDSILNDYGNKTFDVSISHDGDYAIAMIIVY